MNGYNRVILIGNLVRNPELRYTPQGTAVADMTLAINSGRSRQADKGDDAVFVDVTVWEKQAELCNQYLSKGRAVLIEGRLRQEKWTDKESGQKRSKLSVVGDRVQFLGGPADGQRGGEGGEGGQAAYGSPAGGNSQGGAQSGSGRQSSEPLDSPFPPRDDVPF